MPFMAIYGNRTASIFAGRKAHFGTSNKRATAIFAAYFLGKSSCFQFAINAINAINKPFMEIANGRALP